METKPNVALLGLGTMSRGMAVNLRLKFESLSLRHLLRLLFAAGVVVPA